MAQWGKLTDFEEIRYCDLGQTLERSARLCPDKTALIYEDQRVTYKELNDRVDALASSLQALGIKKGDRVAIDLVNCPEQIVAYFAVCKLGGIIAWCNPLYRAEEFRFLISNSGSCAVILHKEFRGFDYLAMLRSMRHELPQLKHVIALGGGAGRDALDFDQLVRQGWGHPYRKAEIDPKADLAMLLYTGGTTGAPKGAMHTHEVCIHSSGIIIPVMGVTADDVYLSLIPLYHAFGLGLITNAAVQSQASIVLMPEYKAELALQLIQEHKVTVHHAAPTHILLETSHPNFHKYDLSSLRVGLGGGFAWPLDLFRRAEQELGLELFHGWGMAEVAGLGFACHPKDPNRDTSIGHPIAPGARAKAIDPATGQEAPSGQPGELLFAGNILKGYWNNPAETAKAIDSEGFLHTGDQVTIDEQGYVRITSRLKEIIKKGGYSINPNEIESLLCEHPRVREACVIGTPNPVMGESICACVVTKDGKPLTLKEVRGFMHDRIASYKIPDELCVMPDFPRLAGGIKIRKFGPDSVQEMAIADVNRERFRK
ncbi:MAG: class I adenylate-forming enzyme family protein [Dehalococcoidia bacterium]|nr:class I adenylate-forming enzyme family protein [Dehalococcoidia bacterium]